MIMQLSNEKTGIKLRFQNTNLKTKDDLIPITQWWQCKTSPSCLGDDGEGGVSLDQVDIPDVWRRLPVIQLAQPGRNQLLSLAVNEQPLHGPDHQLEAVGILAPGVRYE